MADGALDIDSKPTEEISVREVFGIDDERIIVEPTALDEISGLIREGAITHALVIAAFHLLEVEGLA